MFFVFFIVFILNEKLQDLKSLGAINCTYFVTNKRHCNYFKLCSIFYYLFLIAYYGNVSTKHVSSSRMSKREEK